MYKTFTSNISPFGGISLIHKQLLSKGVVNFIDAQLGNRVKTVGYNYSELILSRIYTCFCGGTATEDVNYIRENTLNYLRGIKIPSADTILRGDKELSVASEFIETDSVSKQQINVNNKMNDFLLACAIEFKQLNPASNNLVLDFDHQFIPAEKYDAQYSYKKQKGYFPGVATINNIPVYLEGRNGNCSVKTAQLQTHQRILASLKTQEVKPSSARMDCGSYIKEVTDFYHQQQIKFFIRASSSATLLQQASEQTQWESCCINFQDLEVTSFNYEFGKHRHRIIAYRYPNKTGQKNLLTNDTNNYLFIITNDKEISEQQAIVFYNKRGDSERVFDIQNNDFNWSLMPHSFLDQNTVYLIIMAVAHIIYKWVLSLFCDIVQGVTKTSRLKKFIFKFINTIAKFTTSGRQNITHLITDNQKLIDFMNTT